MRIMDCAIPAPLLIGRCPGRDLRRCTCMPDLVCAQRIESRSFYLTWIRIDLSMILSFADCKEITYMPWASLLPRSNRLAATRL
jgi:hypothetical protein